MSDMLSGIMGDEESPDQSQSFRVHLDVFSGPFDLLLRLIGTHELDITEVALAQVTDEFLAYIRAHGPRWDLDQTSQFLLVAATLLDLKTARLLPATEVEDEEDLAVLEARDLLFARLLQYRAYQQVAVIFADRMAAQAQCFPRTVGVEPPFTALLPEVILGVNPQQFAAVAGQALAPKVAPVVPVEHLHASRVSVREQAVLLVQRLRRLGRVAFRTLTLDCPDTLTVVARFLALLDLYRSSSVAFEQLEPMGELHIRWTGASSGGALGADDFAEPKENAVPPGRPAVAAEPVHQEEP